MQTVQFFATGWLNYNNEIAGSFADSISILCVTIIVLAQMIVTENNKLDIIFNDSMYYIEFWLMPSIYLLHLIVATSVVIIFIQWF